MTKAEVKSKENITKVFKESEDEIQVDNIVLDYSCVIIYRFINKKLKSIEVVFLIDHKVKSTYYDDYYKIKKVLIDKYGKPYYEHKAEEYEYKTKWKNSKTSVLLMMSEEDDGKTVDIGIGYTENGYLDKLKKENSKKQKGQL